MPDSDLLSLWITLVVLYLLEGFAFVPSGSVAFVWTRKRSLRPRFPPTWLRNDRGGIVFGTPWPWDMGIVIADGLRLGIGPNGIYRYRLEELDPIRPVLWTPDSVSFDRPEVFSTEGRTLLANGHRFVSCGTPTHAEGWLAQITEWLKVPAARRSEHVQTWMEQITDATRIADRLTHVANTTVWLRVFGTATTIVALAGLPIADATVGLVEAWPWVLGATYATGWAGTVAFYVAHRSLWRTRRADRWTQVVLQLLVPIVTMRASEWFAKTALVGFHPLGIVSTTQSKADRSSHQRFAKHLIRDLVAQRGTDYATMDTHADPIFFAWKTHVFRWIDATGMDVQSWLVPPEPESPAMTRYCPRCLAQFPASTALCSDCGGIVLSPTGPEALFSMTTRDPKAD